MLNISNQINYWIKMNAILSSYIKCCLSQTGIIIELDLVEGFKMLSFTWPFLQNSSYTVFNVVEPPVSLIKSWSLETS